jgi:hypothetical protein
MPYVACLIGQEWPGGALSLLSSLLARVMHWILMASHFWWVLLMQGTMAGVLQVEGKRMERRG